MSQKATLTSFMVECVKHFYLLVAGQILVGIIWAIDMSLRPYLLKLLVDEASKVYYGSSLEYLTILAGFYLFASFFLTSIFRFYDLVWMYLNNGLKAYICTGMIERLMLHSHAFYQNNFAGRLSGKVKDLMSGAPDLLQIFFERFFSHGLALIIAVGTVWQVNIKFAIALCVWVIIFLAGTIVLTRRAKEHCEIAAELRSSLMGYMVDLLSNMLSVRLFNNQRVEMTRLEGTLKEFTDAYLARDWFFVKLFAFQGFSFVAYQGVTIFYLVSGLQEGGLTAGDFALILTLNVQIIDCLWNLAKDIRKFSELAGDIRQGLTIVNAELEVQDAPDAKDLVIKAHDQEKNFFNPLFGGKIAFDKVRFNYAGSPPLFEDKTVIIEPGQKVGLVGYSGSGKSTFVSLILRLFDITSGRILIDDQDIKNVTQKSLREVLAIIPQEPYLFHRSLRENIRYGRPNATEEEVIKAARKAHAHGFIMELPEKYDALIGERGIKLSGGQRQRIAIARAILKDAPILILDEATSHLDSITEQYIQDSLFALMEGRTTIVIAHRLSTLLHMDRILVFDNGRIVEDGPHKELLARNELYATLWKTQVDGFLPLKKEGKEVPEVTIPATSF